MKVIKRNGKTEDVKLEKVTKRVDKLSYGLNVQPLRVSQKVIAGIFDGITSTQIDSLLTETAAVLGVDHPDYLKLAARIAVSSLHKSTKGFYQTMKDLYKDDTLSEDFIELVRKYGKEVEKYMESDRDLEFEYFGYKTLEKSYLLKINGVVVERPQHMFMRVALAIGGDNMVEVKKLYDHLSLKQYTHATPTLFNAGTRLQQMSSCFLIAMEDDSIEGIYNTAKECALISKNAGGIGLHIHDIRAKGSYISGTNGISNGIVPMLQVFNSTARYVDQGGGKRKGSFAIYLEPWHADIEAFIELRKKTGKEEFRARDLYYALWTPDLFMMRVKEDGMWTLMCPHECPGLSDVYGEEFVELYTKYEEEGKGRKTIKARELWSKILEAQIETGMPFMLYKDACNEKSNQKNIGVIKSSNLCTEIMEVSTPKESAVCNLASIALPPFVKIDSEGKKYFDLDSLHEITKTATRNLNIVIDKNYYPTNKTSLSNMRHRPIGLGVQGLANVFFEMKYPYGSPESRELNKQIFETIYHAALESSCELSVKDGAYATFQGSPASQGILQYDMWGVKPSPRWDWKTLKANIKKLGLRNSLLVAPMPTASTASIFGNIEAFEAQTSNIYKRQVLAGEYVITNAHLVRDLEELGLWTDSIRNKLIEENGSVQNIPEIPTHIKELYKTVWEISQKVIIEMAADRGAFIDQSQSLNLWLAKPSFGSVNTMHFYAWEKGLKTGMYYLRSRPAADAEKVTTTNNIKIESVKEYSAQEAIMCSIDDPEDCIACGS